VHDELVYEVDATLVEAAASAIRETMEHAAPVDKLSGVPILAEVSVGQNWGEMKAISRHN
jgi:DNA polymerase I-like protein with 3'-5' exonuclease and polymerase domains